MEILRSLAAGTAFRQESLSRAPARPFGELLRAWLKIIAALSVGFVYGARVAGPSSIFLWKQDVPVLAACVALTALLGAIAWRPAPTIRLGPSALWPVMLAALCFVAGAAGAHAVFGGYALSQDEFLANFDAQVFASGHLFAPDPPAWRPYAGALQPTYMLPLPPSLWASAYLPVNAALRALGRMLGAEGLVNPALSAFSIMAVWGVGRRIWPEQPQLALIAAALLGTSSQLIVTSMTAYAMPAHLAFNLAWLWLFLRGGRVGHAGAIAVGFLACGIHQQVFHPLFVAPFILQLWQDRRWRLAGLYAAAYALIGLFWLAYWPLTLRLSGVTAGAHTAAPLAAWWAARMANTLGKVRIDSLGQMGESLIRFVSWQNPLTAPLALAGAAAAIRLGGTLRALTLGLVLTTAVMLVVSPYQSSGWGYRYLHGLLGSISLIAAWSWVRLTERIPADRRPAAGSALVIACAVSLLALTPLRAWQAWSYVRPYAAADRAIRSTSANVVLVDNLSHRFFDLGTLNRNGPFLGRGPKVMALAMLDELQLRQLCSTRNVALFDGDSAARFGIDLTSLAPPPSIVRRRALIAEIGCGRPFAE